MKLHELNNRADWNSGIRGLMRPQFPWAYVLRLEQVKNDTAIQISDRLVANIKTRKRI